jgi:hypothetical protein
MDPSIERVLVWTFGAFPVWSEGMLFVLLTSDSELAYTITVSAVSWFGGG